MDSQPLTGLNDLIHESIVSCTWVSSIASSQMRGTGQIHSLVICQLLRASLFKFPSLTTYEHYDLLLRMIDKASQIEEGKERPSACSGIISNQNLLSALPSMESRKYQSLRRRLVSPSPYLPERIPSISHHTGSESR